MRVAYVCADAGIPVFGSKGCSIHVMEFVRALTSCGAKVTLFATRLGGCPPAGFEAVNVHDMGVDRQGGVEERERAAIVTNDELRSLLQLKGPFDLVYERFSLFAFAGVEYALAIGVPGILEVNAPLIEEQSQYRRLANRQGAQDAARRAFNAASMLVAVSDEVADYLKQYPEAYGRVEVVPNGVDPNVFRPRANHGVSSRAGFTVGFVGSLKPWHGLLDLVAAFAALRQNANDARLLIVGEGPERPRLEQTLLTHELRDSVRLTGAVSHDEVPSLLAAIDAAVAPYPRLANFYFSPLKLFEYMAAGLPVVASRTGQVAKLIEDGVTGLLYEPGDASGMRAALERLRLEPKLRLKLGSAARAEILRGHTWNAVVTRILELNRARPAESKRKFDKLDA
jgi:glycosyltransferase involved in cell wall biosynthesis